MVFFLEEKDFERIKNIQKMFVIDMKLKDTRTELIWKSEPMNSILLYAY